MLPQIIKKRGMWQKYHVYIDSKKIGALHLYHHQDPLVMRFHSQVSNEEYRYLLEKAKLRAECEIQILLDVDIVTGKVKVSSILPMRTIRDAKAPNLIEWRVLWLSKIHLKQTRLPGM